MRFVLGFVVATASAAGPPATEPDTIESLLCQHEWSLDVELPPGTPTSYMISPNEGPTEGRIPDWQLAGKNDRARITQAISSALSNATVEVTPANDGSYRVHVLAREGQAATCHGREDKLDLSGIATVKGSAFAVKLTGVVRIVEDVCKASGNGRQIVQRVRAKATLRISKPC